MDYLVESNDRWKMLYGSERSIQYPKINWDEKRTIFHCSYVVYMWTSVGRTECCEKTSAISMLQITRNFPFLHPVTLVLMTVWALEIDQWRSRCVWKLSRRTVTPRHTHAPRTTYLLHYSMDFAVLLHRHCSFPLNNAKNSSLFVRLFTILKISILLSGILDAFSSFLANRPLNLCWPRRSWTPLDSSVQNKIN